MAEAQVVGNLTTEETEAIARHQQIANQILNQIGQIEVRKARLLALVERNELDAQNVLAGVKERLEIPDETSWKIQDGEVLTLPATEAEEV